MVSAKRAVLVIILFLTNNIFSDTNSESLLIYANNNRNILASASYRADGLLNILQTLKNSNLTTIAAGDNEFNFNNFYLFDYKALSLAVDRLYSPKYSFKSFADTLIGGKNTLDFLQINGINIDFFDNEKIQKLNLDFKPSAKSVFNILIVNDAVINRYPSLQNEALPSSAGLFSVIRKYNNYDFYIATKADKNSDNIEYYLTKPFVTISAADERILKLNILDNQAVSFQWLMPEINLAGDFLKIKNNILSQNKKTNWIVKSKRILAKNLNECYDQLQGIFIRKKFPSSNYYKLNYFQRIGLSFNQNLTAIDIQNLAPADDILELLVPADQMGKINQKINFNINNDMLIYKNARIVISRNLFERFIKNVLIEKSYRVQLSDKNIGSFLYEHMILNNPIGSCNATFKKLI